MPRRRCITTKHAPPRFPNHQNRRVCRRERLREPHPAVQFSRPRRCCGQPKDASGVCVCGDREELPQALGGVRRQEHGLLLERFAAAAALRENLPLVARLAPGSLPLCVAGLLDQHPLNLALLLHLPLLLRSSGLGRGRGRRGARRNRRRGQVRKRQSCVFRCRRWSRRRHWSRRPSRRRRLGSFPCWRRREQGAQERQKACRVRKRLRIVPNLTL
mmetsp:Transcript_25222/g.82795  ORF Transcript_25222/g.82795 Transcript_25222/m.82795 type:complete len:216 (-) Transcript_25222:30-677(-)